MNEKIEPGSTGALSADAQAAADAGAAEAGLRSQGTSRPIPEDALIILPLRKVVMFPGTLSAMTTGRVTRAWAAWHHPAWFRVQDRRKAGASR